MRTDIPLREITTEEIWKEVQKVREELKTHNHLTFGSQSLTGTVVGILQSPNFVSGSAGWQLTPDGSFEGNSGTFRGDLVGNSITGATITGGLIQTATSGQRVELSDANNDMRFYSSTGDRTMTLYGYRTGGINYMFIYAGTSAANESIRCGNNELAISGVTSMLVQNTGAGGAIFIFQGIEGADPKFCYLANNTAISGSPGAWKEVRSYIFSDLCNIYDNLDAISILKSIEKKGKDKYGHDKMDLDSLPDFITNKMTKEKGEQTFRNLGRYVDLLAASIKQLDNRLKELE